MASAAAYDDDDDAPPPGWTCPSCTFANSAFLTECEICGQEAPDEPDPEDAGGGGGDGGGGAARPELAVALTAASATIARESERAEAAERRLVVVSTALHAAEQSTARANAALGVSQAAAAAAAATARESAVALAVAHAKIAELQASTRTAAAKAAEVQASARAAAERASAKLEEVQTNADRGAAAVAANLEAAMGAARQREMELTEALAVARASLTSALGEVRTSKEILARERTTHAAELNAAQRATEAAVAQAVAASMKKAAAATVSEEGLDGGAATASTAADVHKALLPLFSAVEGALDDQLCVICADMPQHPCTLGCGHSFCRDRCLVPWMSRPECEGGGTCPSCRFTLKGILPGVSYSLVSALKGLHNIAAAVSIFRATDSSRGGGGGGGVGGGGVNTSAPPSAASASAASASSSTASGRTFVSARRTALPTPAPLVESQRPSPSAVTATDAASGGGPMHHFPTPAAAFAAAGLLTIPPTAFATLIHSALSASPSTCLSTVDLLRVLPPPMRGVGPRGERDLLMHVKNHVQDVVIEETPGGGGGGIAVAVIATWGSVKGFGIRVRAALRSLGATGGGAGGVGGIGGNAVSVMNLGTHFPRSERPNPDARFVDLLTAVEGVAIVHTRGGASISLRAGL